MWVVITSTIIRKWLTTSEAIAKFVGLANGCKREAAFRITIDLVKNFVIVISAHF
ncbi:hypothetical protein KR100_01975 [Synechococcus sp. KORDI-100]|nr:hypothetical protein KR100_01975 [Synechococcus sp. KORDI-100]